MNHFDGLLDRCPYCKRFMTPEQVENHICDSPLVNVKEIDVIYYFEKDENTIIARGLDAILYKLCKLNSSKTTRRNLTRNNNRRELDRTRKHNLYYFICSSPK